MNFNKYNLEHDVPMTDKTLALLNKEDPNGPIRIAPGIWWVGYYLPDDKLQCLTYLIEDGDQSVLIDPGSRLTIGHTLKKIRQVMSFDQIRYFICHHQDPDLTAALPEIDKIVTREDAVVISHRRGNALLRHYNIEMPFVCCEKMGWELSLPHRRLKFVFTPYLHFPGAFCTFDEETGILFSSDLFGGLTKEWQLVAQDENYFDAIKPFHEQYMPSKEIIAAGLNRLNQLPINAIAPQHGSIVPGWLVPILMGRLRELETDLDMKHETIRDHILYQYQIVFNTLLSISMKRTISLQEMLQESLQVILDVSWLPIESRGAIFIMNAKSNELELVAHQGLAKPLLERCAKVSLGHCLCGQAAETKGIVFADHVDDNHVTAFDGMTPHGHYCVPIILNNQVMGVLNLYVTAGHAQKLEEESALYMFAGILANMIKNKLLENKLIESEQKFSSLAYLANDAIIMMDHNGNISFWSRAAEFMFGYSHQEAMGKDLHQLIAPDRYLELFNIGFKEFKKTGQGKIIGKIREIVGLRRSGREFPLELSVSAIRLNDQWQAVSVIRDITQRKRHEEREKFTSFQAGVAEMSISVLHNIGNAIMSITNRADEVNKGSKELERMAGIFSKIGILAKKRMEKGQSERETLDQLVNVIEEIGGDIQAIIDDKLSDNTKKIMEGVQHISEIIKIQQNAEQSPTHRSIFDLSQLVEDAIILQQCNLTQSEIEIDIQVDKGLSEINMPRSQFLQAVVNLVNNSIEAIEVRKMNEQFKIKGVITISSLLLNDHSLEFRIKDNGCGIPGNKLVDIFRYGYTTKQRGTGFGLHSVSTFVQSLEGSIDAQSQGKDQGCELVIQIPLTS